MRRVATAVAMVAALAIVWTSPTYTEQAAQQGQLRRPDIHWVPTPDAVVNAMLKMAKVSASDVVYDLGCGDGKIVIAAAKLGARGVGIDIDPQRVKEANENVKKNGVADKVTIMLGDVFDPSIKISEASVVTLYLLESLNIKLAPRLKKELKPGTRIVSHAFSMGSDWPAEQTQSVDYTQIYLWTIPAR
jgi:cyclopropane fatty-acyl-phospholipid synthase-like methyltransferase